MLYIEMIKKILFFTLRYLFPLKGFNYSLFFAVVGQIISTSTIIIFIAVSNGFKQSINEHSYLLHGGHISIESDPFHPKELNLSHIEKLKKMFPHADIRPFICESGILFTHDKKHTPIFSTSGSEKYIKEKTKLESKSENKNIFLGKTLMKALKIQKGDKINFLSRSSIKQLEGLDLSSVWGQIKLLYLLNKIYNNCPTYIVENGISSGIDKLDAYNGYSIIDSKAKIFTSISLILDENRGIAKNDKIISQTYKKLHNEFSKDYIVKEYRKANKLQDKVIRTLSFTMFSLIILVLFISIFSTISTFFLLIKDKKHLIGILKSMGVSNTFISFTFILCSIVISIFSSITGNILGCLVIRGIQLDIHPSYRIPIIICSEEMLYVDILSICTSVISCCIPLFKIQKIQPVKIINQSE